MALTIQDQIIIEMRADMRQLQRDLRRAEQETRNANNSMRSQFRRTAASIRLTQAAVASLAATVVGEYGIRATTSILETADAWNLTNARIRLVSDSSDELIQKQEAIFDIAQRSRAAYESLANLYTRIARNTFTMNIEDEKRLTVTEAIAKALVISGANAASANAALVQFTQGLAADALRGQELNSVMEQIPRVSQAIADGLHVQIGELRNMAKEGKLTAAVVLNSLVSQKDKIDKEFSEMARTMGQSTTQMSNAWQRFVGQLDRSLGITDFVTSRIDALRKALDDTDKTLPGLQNHYIDAIKGMIAASDLWVDRLVWIGLNAYQGFDTIGPALKSEYTIFMAWLDKEMLAFDLSIEEIITRMKLKIVEWINWLTGIDIAGTQITNPLLGNEEEALKNQLKAIEDFRKKSNTKYLQVVAEEGERMKKLTEFTDEWIKKAAEAAAVTKEMRLDALKAAEAQKRAQEKFKRSTSLYTKTGPSPSQLKEAHDKLMKRYNKESNALILRLEKERALKKATLQRRELDAQFKLVTSGTSDIQQRELLITKQINRAQQDAKLIAEEINQLLKARQTTIVKEKIASLRNTAARELIALAVRYNKLVEERIRLNYRDLEVNTQIQKALTEATQVESQREINNAVPAVQPVLEAKFDVDKAKAAYEQIKLDVEAYSKLRTKTADQVLIKTKKETELLKAGVEYEKAKNKYAEIRYRLAMDTVAAFADTFAQTGDFAASIRGVLEDFINSLTQGDWGKSGTIVGVVLQIFRGISKDTAEQIKQKIEEVKGQTKFEGPTFSTLKSAFSAAQYPLLAEARETNRHLTALVTSFNRTAISIANISLSDQGKTYLSSLNGSGADLYNYSRSSELGITTHSRKLIDSGLFFGEQSFRDLLSAQSANIQAYLSAEFKSTGLWGLLSSTKTRRELTQLPPEIKTQLAQSFNEGYQAILSSAVALGFDRDKIAKLIGDQTVNIDFVSLFDLDKEALAKRLDEIFSEVFNGVIEDSKVFSELVSTFRRGTETDLQTLVRISLEYQQATQALQLAGLNINDAYRIQVSQIITNPGNAPITPTFENFNVNDVTPTQQQYIDLLREATGVTDGFNESMRATIQVSENATQTIETQRISAQEQTIALVEQAGGMSEFASLVSTYTNSILTDEQRTTMELNNLRKVFADYNLTLPKTLQGYRDLLAAQDTSTKAGRETYIMLLQMSQAFADTRDTAEEAAKEVDKSVSDYVDRITRAITGDLSPYTSEQQANFMTQFANMQDRSTKEGAKNYLDSLEEALRSSKDMVPTVEEYMRRFDTYIDAVQRVEKEKDINDLWSKAEEILNELRHQTTIEEQASYQDAL